MAPTLSRYLPPLALIGVIFFLSAQPDLGSASGPWDVLLRKVAHMVEFGLLWILVWRALGYRRPALAAGIVLLYAASDELHQSLVPGRFPSPFDWLIDAAGVGLAALLSVAAVRRLRARTARPEPDRYSQPRSVA